MVAQRSQPQPAPRYRQCDHEHPSLAESTWAFYTGIRGFEALKQTLNIPKRQILIKLTSEG